MNICSFYFIANTTQGSWEHCMKIYIHILAVIRLVFYFPDNYNTPISMPALKRILKAV